MSATEDFLEIKVKKHQGLSYLKINETTKFINPDNGEELSEPEAEPNAETDAEPNTEAEADAEPNTEAEADVKSDVKSDAETNTNKIISKITEEIKKIPSTNKVVFDGVDSPNSVFIKPLKMNMEKVNGDGYSYYTLDIDDDITIELKNILTDYYYNYRCALDIHFLPMIIAYLMQEIELLDIDITSKDKINYIGKLLRWFNQSYFKDYYSNDRKDLLEYIYPDIVEIFILMNLQKIECDNLYEAPFLESYIKYLLNYNILKDAQNPFHLIYLIFREVQQLDMTDSEKKIYILCILKTLTNNKKLFEQIDKHKIFNDSYYLWPSIIDTLFAINKNDYQFQKTPNFFTYIKQLFSKCHHNKYDEDVNSVENQKSDCLQALFRKIFP